MTCVAKVPAEMNTVASYAGFDVSQRKKTFFLSEILLSQSQ